MNKNIEIVTIIPARGGSKGIPEKNIKILNNKPLIAYTIEAAKKSKYLSKILVSTDCKKIAKVCKEFGAEVPYLRPTNLSTDDSPTIDAVVHMLNWLKENENYSPDYVCLLQCTSPLRDENDINGAIEKLLTTEMDGIVSVCEAEVNPYWTNVLVENQLKYFIKEGKDITRRQDLPLVYRINGAIYGMKTDVIIENYTLEPEKITGYVMSNKKSIDIDNIVDFKLAEILMKECEEEYA